MFIDPDPPRAPALRQEGLALRQEGHVSFECYALSLGHGPPDGGRPRWVEVYKHFPPHGGPVPAPLHHFCASARHP